MILAKTPVSREKDVETCSDDLKPGDCEMVVGGGGHFSPSVIDGVHTCLYYSRPIQHLTVPRVTQYNTHTDILRPLIDCL